MHYFIDEVLEVARGRCVIVHGLVGIHRWHSGRASNRHGVDRTEGSPLRAPWMH